MNTVTETHVFWLNGTSYRLGRVREMFRTSYSGQSNTPGAAPSGWFGGNAIGAEHCSQRIRRPAAPRRKNADHRAPAQTIGNPFPKRSLASLAELGWASVRVSHSPPNRTSAPMRESELD
jgi:hypothetical protein